MTKQAVSAHSQETSSAAAAQDLCRQLENADPTLVVVFSGYNHDGASLTGRLHEQFPRAEVVGCSTAGEYINQRHSNNGVAVLALPDTKVAKCAAALVDCTGKGMKAWPAALDQLSSRMGTPLRDLDDSNHVGLILVDGAHAQEEMHNAQLGNAAPFLSFVGGSAADNLAFKETFVFHNGRVTNEGAVVVVARMAVPFMSTRICHFCSTGKTFRVTRASHRVIQELDGKPAAQVYAQALGISADALRFEMFFPNPLGLVIDGEAWPRSPNGVEGTGLRLACSVAEGSEVHLLKRGADLLDHTSAKLADATRKLGGPVGAALLFNCAYRRLEMDQQQLHDKFVTSLTFPAAGFHTFGESLIGHVNQTLTALLMG